MTSGLRGGGEDDEHNGVGFVVISRIFRMNYTFFFETEPFDRKVK